MLHRGKIAIIAAAFMIAISSCGCIDLSVRNSSVSNVPHNSTVTITTSNANPAVNQSFTLSGTLTDNGTPLAGKTITLRRMDQSQAWSDVLGTTTTTTTGTYAISTKSALGTYTYYAIFGGDATYAYSYSPGGVHVVVGTPEESTISIHSTNMAPAVNEPYTLYGTLQDGVSGAPLAGQLLNLSVIDPSGQVKYMSATTGADGSYTFTRSESTPGTYIDRVHFRSNLSYVENQAMVTLNVGNLIPTTLSVDISNNNPGVNQSFTISGYLTDVNGTKLAGMRLSVDREIGRVVTSKPDTTTDSNGHYSVTISEQTSGQYYYEIIFWGDGTYAAWTGSVYAVVGTVLPSKITATTNITNPHVGQSYTLSGYLTDANGNPLSGREIDLFKSSSQQGDIWQKAYTDQNGHYSFVLNESASGTQTYTARFYGDQYYAYVQARVTVNVSVA